MSRTDARLLKAHLQELSQTDRYILLLSLADGLTPTEVALVLDLPESTVETRLHVLRHEAARVIERARGQSHKDRVRRAVSRGRPSVAVTA